MSKLERTVLTVLLLLALALGVYNDSRLEGKIEKKQERIEMLQGQLDSAHHTIRNLRQENRKLKRRLQKSVMWTTRALVSETRRLDEMRVIAEVIRNRVETGWRGNHTYKSVILDPYQFSAFNPMRRRAEMYRTMTTRTTPYPERWRAAKNIARRVIMMPRDSMVTDRNVVHFHHSQVDPQWSDHMIHVPVGGERLLTYRNPRIKVQN